MTNRKIVAKGEQIKDINIELNNITEQIEALKAQQNQLTYEKRKLTAEIIELKHADNKIANEQLVNEWLSEVTTKFDNEISADYDSFTQRSYITVSLCHQVTPQFAVTNTMLESQVKDYLHGIENTIKLYNELTAQNVFENLNLTYGYINENPFCTILMPKDDEHKSISLRLHNNGTVNVKIEDRVYDMPRYKAELYGGLTLVPVRIEDEYGNDINEYPFKLYNEQIMSINMLNTNLKLMLENFENSKNKFIKPFNE